MSDTANVRANFDLLVGFLPGAVGKVNQSGGTFEAGPTVFGGFGVVAVLPAVARDAVAEGQDA